MIVSPFTEFPLYEKKGWTVYAVYAAKLNLQKIFWIVRVTYYKPSTQHLLSPFLLLIKILTFCLFLFLLARWVKDLGRRGEYWEILISWKRDWCDMGSCLLDSCCLKQRCDGWNYSSQISRIRQAWGKTAENCINVDPMISHWIDTRSQLLQTSYDMRKTPEFRKNFCNSMFFIKIDKSKNVVKKLPILEKQRD